MYYYKTHQLSLGDGMKSIYMQSYKIVIFKYFILVSILFLCSCDDSGLIQEGYWIRSDNERNTADIFILNNECIFIDCLGNLINGTVDREGEIHFNLGGDKNTLSYEVISDSLILLEQVEYQYTGPNRPNNDTIKFEILGLDSDLIFPFTNLVDEKWLKIKLRNSSKKYPLILGSKKSSLDDLLLYAPRTICSNTMPKQIFYDQVVIQVEKGASVKDLFNIQQQLYIEHRISNFVIITDILALNSYQCVVDQKYRSNSVEETIYENILDYMDAKWPPRPIFPYEESFEEEITKLNVVKVDSYFDFINLEEMRISKYRENLFVISDDLQIEEYLSVLSQIQSLRVIKGYKISTHFLDFI